MDQFYKWIHIQPPRGVSGNRSKRPAHELLSNLGTSTAIKPKFKMALMRQCGKNPSVPEQLFNL